MAEISPHSRAGQDGGAPAGPGEPARTPAPSDSSDSPGEGATAAKPPDPPESGPPESGPPESGPPESGPPESDPPAGSSDSAAPGADGPDGPDGAPAPDASSPDGVGEAPSPFRAFFRGLLGSRGNDDLRERLEELIEEGAVEAETSSSIGGHERTLIANVLKLRDISVADVMIPRADIVAVDETSGMEALVDIAVNKPHSRFPVYRGSLDDILGILHVKDLLAALAARTPFELGGLIREVLVVAPSMPVLDLLLEMREKRLHLALVVDEFGGIDGLVTIEDLVEEIVGEIEDEHDLEEAPRMRRARDGTWIADARLPVSELEARFGPLLEEEERAEVDTLGGLVTALAGEVPSRGALLRHPGGLDFEVLEADLRRVRRLRLRPWSHEADSVRQAGAATGPG